MEKAEQGRPSPTSSMQVMVEVVGGRHIAQEKGSLFVRCHVEGVVTMNTKHVPAASAPHWAEAVSLHCTSSNAKLVSQLQSHSLVFELRCTTQSVWGNWRGSKRLGSVRIAWRDLLESHTEDWFLLTVKGGLKDGHKPPALRLALSVTPPTPLPRVERSASGLGSSACKRNVTKRRSRYLDRNECGCRGHTCSYQGALMSSWDATWGI